MKILLLVFSCSLSALAFEVTLSRVFAVSLGYHFSFMIVSIAMLGIAAAGTAIALFPRLGRPESVPFHALALGTAVSFCYLAANLVPFDPARLAWSPFHLLLLGVYYPVLSLPFFFSGLVIAGTLSSAGERANLVYGMDLLGAGTGSLAVLGALSALPPERAVLALSIIVLGASSIALPRRLRAIPLAPACLGAAVFLGLPGLAETRIPPFRELPAALQYPGASHLGTVHGPFSRLDIIDSPAVRLAPGLSLRYREALPEQIGLAIDGGVIETVTAPGDEKLLEFLDWMPAALPWHLAPPGPALVLDPGGGLPLLAAHYREREVFAVEGNPLLLRVMRRELAGFSGALHGSNTEAGLGRAWLARTGKKFALVDISLLGASPAGRFGIAEDYRFTVEAFRTYLDGLSPDGLLAVNLYLQPPARTELRMVATIAEALGESGAGNPAAHLAVIRSWGMMTIVAGRQELDRARVERIREFARERWFDPVLLPGAKGPRESGSFVETADGALGEGVNIMAGGPGRREFLARYPFDVSPVRDDSPFFHYYFRLDRLGDTWRLMDRRWNHFVEQGLVLPPIMLQALLAGGFLIVLPALAGKKRGRRRSPGAGEGRGFIFYFACLGAGYMFVFTTLVQKMVLPFEHAPLALASVLASTLLGSGTGSVLGHRFPALRNPAATLPVALAALAYGRFSGTFAEAAALLPLPLRIPALFIFLLPLTVFMGIPFPAGLNRLKGRPDLIAWAWAANGGFSVMAPPAAVMTAMAFGFRAVLWCGAAAYLGAFLASRSPWPGRYAKRPGQERLKPIPAPGPSTARSAPPSAPS